MTTSGQRSLARLRNLLRLAARAPDRADAGAIAEAAAQTFEGLRRTDMRSGVANIIRRLALLDRDGAQPIPPEGWTVLSAAADLLDRPGLAPADVRALDERLQSIGLDVDFRPSSVPHQAGQQNPN